MLRLIVPAAIVCLAFLACRIAGGASAPPDAPLNVLVIVSDDHRADVLGCAGHPIVRTPSLDVLAASGVRFTDAFVTTSICAASRASILTGLVERTHGFTFGTPPLARELCASSYPARLKAAGYRTGFVGKLGISVEGGADTLASMFDSFVPLRRSPYVKTLEDGTRRHVTDITGDRALEFLASVDDDEPFCLSVSFNAGHAEDGDLDEHYPFPDAEASLYTDVPMPRPRLDGGEVFDAQPEFLRDSMNRDRYHWRWDTPEKYDRNLRNYFRMLSGLDRNVGRILDDLRERELLERTLVVFIGDNGYYMGERGFAGKWSHYDESLRVPLIVHDPRLPASRRGTTSEAIALNIDVAATALEAAGLAVSDHGQGRTLRGPASGLPDDRTGFYCEHRMVHPRIPRWEGYRTRDWKYARYLDVSEDRGELLHDLGEDPLELANRASDPEVRDQLEAMRAHRMAAAERAASEAPAGR